MASRRSGDSGTHAEAPNPSFVQKDAFIENPFERRFQGVLRQARAERSWHVVAAVPGSGKSSGIRDLVRQSGARKDGNGATRLPVLDICAPKQSPSQRALGDAITMSLGRVPSMRWSQLQAWLVSECLRLEVELVVVDDAHELSEPQLAFLRGLIDYLVRQHDGRSIGLCLVSASNGADIPLKELLLAHADDLSWWQFIRRFNATRAYQLVANHTADELIEICAGFEDLYRDQLPDLSLVEWAEPLYIWLTNPILDPGGTRRVTMDNMSKCLTTAIAAAYNRGLRNITEELLHAVATLMTVKRDEVYLVDGEAEDDQVDGGVWGDIRLIDGEA